MKEEKEKAEAGAQANAEELEEVDGRVAGSWKAPHVEPPSDKALGWPGTKVWVGQGQRSGLPLWSLRYHRQYDGDVTC
jgi:hypothetical protein